VEKAVVYHPEAEDLITSGRRVDSRFESREPFIGFLDQGVERAFVEFVAFEISRGTDHRSVLVEIRLH
jgi:hypothetical protein